MSRAFAYFYAEAMCGHTVLPASVNVSLWRRLSKSIDGIFIAWRKNFHHLDCWRGNPLRVSCEAEVESKITLICPWQWSSHWLNSWTANIKRTLSRILIIGIGNCIQLSLSGKFTIELFFDLPLTVDSKIGTTDWISDPSPPLRLALYETLPIGLIQSGV